MELSSRAREKSKAFDMRCYKRLLNILYKIQITNEEVHRKIQAAIGEKDEFPTVVKKIWACLEVFWFSKDKSTGHSEWKRRGIHKKKVGRHN